METNETIRKLHEDACKQGLNSYIDPSTGYTVFTSLHHLNRGYCCDSGCRHCPYPKTEKGEGHKRPEK